MSTKGLSFKHVDVEGTKFIILDSEGSYAPVKVVRVRVRVSRNPNPNPNPNPKRSPSPDPNPNPTPNLNPNQVTVEFLRDEMSFFSRGLRDATMVC